MRCAGSSVIYPSGAAVSPSFGSYSSKRRLKPLTAQPHCTAVQQAYPIYSRHTISSRASIKRCKPLQAGRGTAHLHPSWSFNPTTTGTCGTAASHRWDAMPLTDAHYRPENARTENTQQQHMPAGWGSQDASLVENFQQLFQPRHQSAPGGQQQYSRNDQQQQQQMKRAISSRAAASQKNQGKPGDVDTATLHFSIVRAVEYGQRLRLVGSGKALGSWDALHGPKLKWHEGHKWTTDAQLAVGSHEFKFVTVHRSGEIEWEPGSNRVVQVPASAAEMQVQGTWGDTQDTEVLEVQEHKNFADRRHLLQQLLSDAVTAAEVDTNAATAAAAAETLLNILGFEEEQQQYSIAAAAAEPTSRKKQPQQLQQQQQQPLGPETISGSSSSASTALDFTVADTAGISTALVNTHEQLVSMLLDMRAELTSSISQVTAAVKQVQEELGQVQEQVAQLTAERLLQQHLQQQQRTRGSAVASLDATSSMEDNANTGFEAAVLGLQQQWLEGASSNSSEDVRSQRGYTLKWKQDSGQAAQAQQQQQQQTAADSAAATGAELSSITPACDILPATSTPLGREVMTHPTAALNDINSTVIAWRHEVLSFRQEAMLLKSEVAGLAEALNLLEQQLAANTTALNSLKAVVEQQQQQQEVEQSGRSKSRTGRADSINATSTAPPPAAGAAEQQLLAKFDQLASQLTAEVKSAVQSAVPKQQQIDLLQQLLQNEQLLNQLWTRPPPTEEQHWEQQQHQRSNNVGRHVPSSSSEYDEAAAAASLLLGSNNVQQYHKGVLFCVMLAAGLWEEGLLDSIQGEAMRMTWRGYKACWGDDLLMELKHRINSPQQLLAELHSSSSGMGNTLACHVLWSLMELSTHSTEVAALLQRCASISEMQLMGQLQFDAPHPNCAAVLRRWIAATAPAGQP